METKGRTVQFLTERGLLNKNEVDNINYSHTYEEVKVFNWLQLYLVWSYTECTELQTLLKGKDINFDFTQSHARHLIKSNIMNEEEESSLIIKSNYSYALKFKCNIN